jgi:hypothetical protein
LAKIIPIIFLLFGLAAGGGAGWFLQPAPPEAGAEHDATEGEPTEDPPANDMATEFVRLNNQFVVPVVKDQRVSALVVLSLSLETEVGMSEEVFAVEPKLRDVFLQVLFDHANAGGFAGAFTQAGNMEILRRSLREVAQVELGKRVSNVLIIDIARQDV